MAIELSAGTVQIPRQRIGHECRVGERTHALEIPLTHGPDVDEGNVHGHPCCSGLNLDTGDRDDILAPGDEFLGDEAKVKGSVEGAQKALEHVLEALEV